ncbi:MAG: hypothetical protein ACM359_14075 [Bacillota bacterium]
MEIMSPEFESACRAHLDRFFQARPDDAVMKKRAATALHLLKLNDRPLKGDPLGWAAGIIYAVGTYDRPRLGVPGLLNSEFMELMGVSMETARRRAAVVRELMAF